MLVAECESLLDNNCISAFQQHLIVKNKACVLAIGGRYFK